MPARGRYWRTRPRYATIKLPDGAPPGLFSRPVQDEPVVFFGKKKNDDKSGGGGKGGDGFKRDPRKARRFFEHAETVADARNYDYAIECYVNGLKHDPDNLNMHEALHDVAKRRKVAGGKAAGFAEKLKSGGPSAIDKMLHSERLWSMNMINAELARDVMKHAVDADDEHEDLHMGEVANWAGALALELNKAKNNKKVYKDCRDLFAKIGVFDKAVEACRQLVRLEPDNSNLLLELKNLEAENTMQQGGYTKDAQAEEGGFRNFVRDGEKQKALEQDDSITTMRSKADEIIARRRAEYEEAPEDNDKRLKLVQALVAKEAKATEDEAMVLLKQTWEETGQYRYKVQVGDITMKQFNRYLRELRSQIKQAPEDEKLKTKYAEFTKKKLIFELKEFDERVKNYPTDLGLKFELGRRLFLAGKFDDAIGAFQQAKEDPKHRAHALFYLGDCYLRIGWLDEAIDTLEIGVDQHKIPNDKLAKDLRYLLMEAYEQSAVKNNDLDQAQKAQKIASQLLQMDIGYRDIRERADKLRGLVEKMRQRDPV